MRKCQSTEDGMGLSQVLRASRVGTRGLLDATFEDGNENNETNNQQNVETSVADTINDGSNCRDGGEGSVEGSGDGSGHVRRDSDIDGGCNVDRRRDGGSRSNRSNRSNRTNGSSWDCIRSCRFLSES